MLVGEEEQTVGCRIIVGLEEFRLNVQGTFTDLNLTGGCYTEIKCPIGHSQSRGELVDSGQTFTAEETQIFLFHILLFFDFIQKYNPEILFLFSSICVRTMID